MAVAPKCAVCVAGYLGLGAVFGLGGPEICGAVNEAGSSLSTALIAAGAGVTVGAAGLVRSKWPTRALRRHATSREISQTRQATGTEGAISHTGHRAVSSLPP